MRLLVGGFAQGKLECARQMTGAAESQIIYGEFCPLGGEQDGLVLDGVQLLVRRCMEAGTDPAALLDALIARNPDIVVTAQELGCGIVPMDGFERAWRECCGRVCCALAAKAARVDRVSCGIVSAIK